MDDINTANLYTDFSGLAKLRLKASAEAGEGAGAEAKAEATKEVSRQFEAIFLQNMLKTMREASQLSEETESDQTRFYQEMFDKQIAIDLVSRGEGTGLGSMLEIQLGGGKVTASGRSAEHAGIDTNQIIEQLRKATQLDEPQ